MPGPYLYSTNTLVKFRIQMQFRGDVHYVWCSETFDSNAHGIYAWGAGAGPTSDPLQIYRDLEREIRAPDKHNGKVTEQKLNLSKLATKWVADGEITEKVSEEILYYIASAPSADWRPLVYVVNLGVIDQSRISAVPPDKRASRAPEFIIEDLQRSEFDFLDIVR